MLKQIPGKGKGSSIHEGNLRTGSVVCRASRRGLTLAGGVSSGPQGNWSWAGTRGPLAVDGSLTGSTRSTRSLELLNVTDPIA